MRRALCVIGLRDLRWWPEGPPAPWTPSGGDTQAAADSPSRSSAPDQTLFNEAVVIFSNDVRRKHGRTPLRPDTGLSRAAADHATEHG